MPVTTIDSGQKGPPFSAIVKGTFDQKLGDGNSIHGIVRYHVARDSSGKTMTEIPTVCYVGEDGHAHQAYQINVHDPATRTSENWRLDNTAPRTVNIFHLIPPEKLSQSDLAAAAANNRVRRATWMAGRQTEKLGSRTFQGVSADGIRTTHTIPTGEEGNALPLEVMNESWTSKELAITMMSIYDDPRQGRTTTEIEELHQGDPDPAIFSPPEGYTVKDHPPAASVAAAQ
ncbi:hypothetical protein [Edaphobacter bradus]|uniref:hypothetical protein n=1 Tax=Edaphobacter bradus TaxID=2259016 RepID=UPI0021DFF1AF|nr:hypothetical protein [Edaphobacter bradus]